MAGDNKVVMVFIDAFSSKYLTPELAPFLYKLSVEGFCRDIEHLPAFEGIGSTVFSGTWPSTNGIWTNFVRRKHAQSNLEEFVAAVSSTALNLIPSDRLDWDLRYVIYRLLRKPVPIPNLIPPGLLGHFPSKLMVSIFRERALGEIPTVFDALRDTGSTITFIGSGRDERIAARAVACLRKGDISDLTYLKFSCLDWVGHTSGPESQETGRAVRRIDALVKEVAQAVKERNERVHLLIFSDHGMVPVTRRIDVLKALDVTGLRVGRDYLAFLDSTMARFWFNSEAAGDAIRLVLDGLGCGSFITDEDLRASNLPVNREEHGEAIYALHEGALVYPDFFHRRTTIRGMHGYFRSAYDSPILALFPSAPMRTDIKFTDIMPTTLDLLGVPVPTSCQGTSIISGA